MCHGTQSGGQKVIGRSQFSPPPCESGRAGSLGAFHLHTSPLRLLSVRHLSFSEVLGPGRVLSRGLHPLAPPFL